MQYRRDKKGNELSVLGYGCMRFTKNGSSVDLDKAEKEVMAAIKAGVNYFDTAYVYAGNEAAVGEILDRNCCLILKKISMLSRKHRQSGNMRHFLEICLRRRNRYCISVLLQDPERDLRMQARRQPDFPMYRCLIPVICRVVQA